MIHRKGLLTVKYSFLDTMFVIRPRMLFLNSYDYKDRIESRENDKIC